MILDWAGGCETRKSTSGGVCKIGPHAIKTWSSTQQMIALSPAEVEPYTLLKCACQTLGIFNLALHFGISLKASVHIDASSALATTERQGLGKLRRTDVHWLLLQEKMKFGNTIAHNVGGKDNLADLLTKHLHVDGITKHLGHLDFELAVGKADGALTMNNVIETHGIIHGVVLSGPHPQFARGSRDKSNQFNFDKDYWIDDGQCVTRVHQELRKHLFDPFQSWGAPEVAAFISTRIIHGEYSDGS